MWMFGSRTTVKKVRNSLTWFSQMGVCCRCAACSKSPAGEGCQNSLVLFSLLSIFDYASVDNCVGIPGAPGVISPQRMTGICLINQRAVHSACLQQATAQHRANLLGRWDARPFLDSDANLVLSGVIVSAGVFSNSTPEVTIAIPVEEAPEVALFYRHPLKAWSLDEWGMPICFNRRFHLIWR